MEQFKNFAETTLSANVTSNSQTPVSVANATKLSASGDFRIRVNNEIMLVTSVAGNDLSVTRGVEGTTATTHTSGDAVTQVVTQAAIEAWQAENRLRGAHADLPAAGDAGRMFFPTDGNAIGVDTGSVWEWYGPLKLNLTPPIDSNFSWVNQGSASVSTSKGGVLLSVPAASGYSYHSRYIAKTAPYKITMHFIPFLANVNFPACGMGFRSSVSSKILGINQLNSGEIPYINVFKATNDTTYSSDPTADNGIDFGGAIRWFQIEDDGTTLYFRVSTAGKMWLTVFSEARGTFFSGGNLPTGACFFVKSDHASQPAAMHVLHWLEE